MDIDRPIPQDSVGLADAFARYIDARLHPRARSRDWALRVAERSFRAVLTDRQLLTAYIRDPKTRERLALDADRWHGANWIPGFPTNFIGAFPNGVGNEIEPGSNTVIEGERQPVFFLRREFEAWLKTVQETPAHRRVTGTSNAEKECQRRFEKMMRASPHERTAPRANCIAEARADIGESLSYRGATRAWSNAIAATGAHSWARAGAPKKSQRQ